jgi:hypothetical protein
MKDEVGKMKTEGKAVLPLLHPSALPPSSLDLCAGAKTGKLRVSVVIRFSDVFSIEEL